MRKIVLICAASTLVLTPAFGWSQKKDHLAKYEDGTITVKAYGVKGSEAPKIVVKAIIDAPIEKVWAVVSDCNTYKDHFDRIERSKELKRQGKVVFCETEVDLPFPMSNLTAQTRAVHVETGPVWSRKWTLVKGDYLVNDGSWVVHRHKGSPTRTFAIYTIHAEPTTSVPDWVRNKAQKSALPDMIKRLRKEVKK